MEWKADKMGNGFSKEAREIMDMRFGCDSLIALATDDGGNPSVRTVNSYYLDGSFYVITYALSTKMRQIAKNPRVAICGDWFTAHGVGENMGHILLPENADIASRLRAVFAEWYDNGHINEDDSNTCILRVRLTDGVLFSHGVRYDMDFACE
jgi:general stress protein 26